MKKYSIWFLGLMFLVACQSKEKKTTAPAPKMYEPSEMALLMRQMHALNEHAKAQIVAGKDVEPYPEELANLHSASMTDPTERDAEFDSLAVRFLQYQKNTFGPHNAETKVNYNKSISTCISCHQTRCVGPIPKIKKLFID